MSGRRGGEALTFGGVHAVALPPTRDGSLWAHVAVVNRPGWPLVMDPQCNTNTIYFINTAGRVDWTPRER